MRPDPPMPTDGRCALPGCDKPLVKVTPQHRKYGSSVMLPQEPFCSSTCCREWHGTQIKGTKAA